MEVSWVHLIIPLGVLSMPNSFPGESNVGIQKVYCWGMVLYDNICMQGDFIPHYMEVTSVFIFINIDVLLT